MVIIIPLINTNRYIDCHSHILFGIDDGAPDIEHSVAILKKLVELGFEEVILTPHYINAFHVNNREKRERYRILQERVIREQLPIQLHLANEVRITSDILRLIKEDEITLFAGYIFLELPFSARIHHLERKIYELQLENIKVILVHPERYHYLTKDDYQKLIDLDVMFQVNYGSIIGIYGSKSKKMVKYLLKNNFVSFIGTDIHRSDQFNVKQFAKIKSRVIKIIGEEKFQDISYNNMKKIIHHETW